MSVFDLLSKVYPKPSNVSVENVKNAQNLSAKDLDMMRRIGCTVSNFSEILQKSTYLNFERLHVYREVERAIQHWAIGSALELYSDAATTHSQLHNGTVWITAPDNMNSYQRELNNLIDKLNIEEKIFDWAWNIAAFGDMFVRIEAIPGVGVVFLDDTEHPINISRLENNGRLIGFYNTPLGGNSFSNDPQYLIPPWQYVHFRLLGSKMKRSLYKDQTYTDTITIIAPDTRQITTHYGASILLNALPTYKRLRLAEDSLLIARLSKGILRYIYKVKVDGNNVEAAGEIVNNYSDLLKKARAVDTTPGEANFDEKYNPLSSNEDIIIPVWGDINNFSFDKIGGEVDIKWITDVEELRNQLACALRTPLQLLGGFGKETPAGLGDSALKNMDIRFSRSVRRLQRAIKEGVKRICQIHLAYLNMNTDASMFKVEMSETSSAEEVELKESLEKGTDIAKNMYDLIAQFVPDDKLDGVALLNYLNTKILKLSDFDVNTYLKQKEMTTESIKVKQSKEIEKFDSIVNSDLFAHTVLDESMWRELYGNVKIVKKK